MDQQIRFCSTSDGVSIAYATVGDGPPLVYVCGWPGHLAVEWGKPFVREFLHRLADGFTLVRYDMRGSGLSDQGQTDFTLDGLVKDLEAVVDHLRLDQFPLLCLGLFAGPVAMSFAAAHPERVSSLILSSAYLRGSDITTPERQRAILQFISTFRFFPQSIEDIAPDDLGKWQDSARVLDAAAPGEVQAAVLKVLFSTSVDELVGRIPMPVLILHGQDDPLIPFAQGLALAARIPHAQFVPVEGSTSAPWQQVNVIIPEVRRFLGVGASSSEHERPTAGELVTILFTDIESSTTLTQRLGDAGAQELVRSHDSIVREALARHTGREIKHTGDGIMASFGSASTALGCAIAIQRGVVSRVAPDAEAQLGVRIGVNAGEPVPEDGDLFGTAVQLARRICDQADSGEILVSNVVRELTAGKAFLFADRGLAPLKGFADPVQLYELRWRDA